MIYKRNRHIIACLGAVGVVAAVFNCLLYSVVGQQILMPLGITFFCLFLGLLLSIFIMIKKELKQAIFSFTIALLWVLFFAIPTFGILTSKTEVLITKINTNNTNAPISNDISGSSDLKIVISSICMDGVSQDLSKYENDFWECNKWGKLITYQTSGLAIQLPRFEKLAIHFETGQDFGIASIQSLGTDNKVDIVDTYSPDYEQFNPEATVVLQYMPNFYWAYYAALLGFIFISMFVTTWCVLPYCTGLGQQGRAKITIIIIGFIGVITLLSQSYITLQLRDVFYLVVGVSVLIVLGVAANKSAKLLGTEKLKLLTVLLVAFLFCWYNSSAFVVRNDTQQNIMVIAQIDSTSEIEILSVQVGGEYLALENLSNTEWEVAQDEEGAIGLRTVENGSWVTFPAKASTEVVIIFRTSPTGGSVEITGLDDSVYMNLCEDEIGSSYFLGRAADGDTDYLHSMLLFILRLVVIAVFLYITIVYFMGRLLHKAGALPIPLEKRIEKVLCAVISLIVPLFFYFYLTYNNRAYLNFEQVIIASGCFMLVGVVLHGVMTSIMGMHRAATMFSLGFWIVFFQYKNIYTLLEGSTKRITQDELFAICVVTLVLYSGFVYWLAKKIKKFEVFQAIAIFTAVLFSINSVPYIYWGITNSGGRQAIVKENYIINDDLPSPNIYWILMDGMLGFYGMEKFFDDSQDEWALRLEERGFMINRDAYFESVHGTRIAVPSLMSPSVYGTHIEQQMIGKDLWEDQLSSDSSLQSYRTRVIAPLIKQLYYARTENELLTAFDLKGYRTQVISESDFYTFLPTTNAYYGYHYPGEYYENLSETQSQKLQTIADWAELKNLIVPNTMLSVLSSQFSAFFDGWQNDELASSPLPSSSYDVDEIVGASQQFSIRNVLKSLGSSIESSSPKVTIIHDPTAHYDYIYDEQGVLTNKQTTTEPDAYYAQHQYACRVVINMIDMILEGDPNAVIVVQADHGLHGTTLSQLEEYGFPKEEIVDIWNSVMSAVRIPDEYGGLEEPLDPLNITRELINRFVGENYALLPSDHPNQLKKK